MHSKSGSRFKFVLFTKIMDKVRNPGLLFLFTIFALLHVSEGQILAAPEPSVTINAQSNPFIGENTTIEFIFDNTSSSDTGYGPFVDAILPVNGADGAAGTQEQDGIDVRGDATYLGTPVTTIVQTFPNDGGGIGCVDHPFAVNATTGSPLRVCGTAGDKLVTMQLPFGSFVPAQPAARLSLPVTISQKADVNTALDVRARAGFQYGATAVDDPDTDPPILSDNETDSSQWNTSSQVTPILIRLEKKYIGPEDETATGPNFPRRYTILVRIAPGQTINNLDVIDELPNNMAYKELVSTNPSGGSVVSAPPVNTPANPSSNVLDVQFGSVAADSDPDSVDANVTFEYFIPRLDADNSTIIDPDSGDDVNSTNQARAVGDWTPVDTRDPAGQDNAVADPVGPEHILQDKSIAIQKSVSIVNDVGTEGYSPGDTVEYVLEFQVSDYFSFDDVNVTDVISDGQDYDTSFTPQLILSVHGGNTTSNITPDHTANADGTETLFFKIPQKLSGGCVPDGGTGGDAPDCSVYNGGATTGRIVFHAKVKENFDSQYPSGDESVDQGDVLSDNTTVEGDLLNVADNSSKNGQKEADGSSAGFRIETGKVSKKIYAINGNTVLPDPLIIRPGDNVTYEITFTMPTPDVEELSLTDYLPLPVFDSTTITTFDNTVSSDSPPSGTAKYGPADSFSTIYDDGSGNNYPSISTSSAENSVTFNYGNFDANETDSYTIDILFTVTVKNDPFADGLFLTNMVRAHNGSTNADAVNSDGIVQIKLGEPSLKITKGVSASNNPDANATIAPSPDQKPIDGNMSNSDGNDTVTFVITVENKGHADAYDVTVTDDTNLDMDDCAVASVQDGNGANLGYTGDLFDSNNPLKLDDPLGENGTALITFTCRIKEDVKPTDKIDRRAAVTWAAATGADKYPERADNATVEMALPRMDKSISEVVPGPIANNMTVGDNVTYRIEVTLPEGNVTELKLSDELPQGLEYISGSLDVNTTGFNGSFSEDPPSITINGQQVNVYFGNVTISADNDATNNGFYLTLTAKVLDDSSNSATSSLQTKTNNVILRFGGYSQEITALATNYFGEPFLQVTKTINPSTADAGDEVTIWITVQNTGTSPAYDISIKDTLDSSVFDINNVTEGSTAGNFTYSYSSPTVAYYSDAGFGLDPSQSVGFSFITYVITDIVTSTPYENTADAAYSTQSGDVDGERGGSDNDTATIQIATIQTDKQLVETSEPSTSGSSNPVAIGEIVTFELEFTIPEGNTKGVKLFDLLEPVSGTIWGDYVQGSANITRTSSDLTCDGASICSDLNATAANVWVSADSYIQVQDDANGRHIVLDMGNVTNTNNDNNSTETYKLRLSVVVKNNSVTNAGVHLADRAGLYYQDAAGTEYSKLSEQISLLVVEPRPGIEKSASPQTASGGDEITFTLNICNTASGDSAAPAFDWVFSDTLPDKYNDISSVTTDAGNTGAIVNTTHNERTVNGTIDELDPGECVEVVYKATLKDTAQYGETITNTVSFTATSLPGDRGTADATPGASGTENGERTGSGGVNDLSGSDSASVTVAQPSLTKDMPDHKDWYAVGDDATFRITVGLPGGTSKNLVLKDHIPSGLSLNSGTLNVTLPQGASSSNAPLDETNGAFFTYDAQSGNMTLDFGNVTAQQSGDLIITYSAKVEDIMANQDGTQLVNRVGLTYDDPENPGQSLAVGPVDNQQQVHVGEPNLEISKVITSGATGSDAGDTISWQIQIENVGHTTAYQVNWKDALPDGLYQISNAHVSVTGSVYLNGTTTQPTDGNIGISTTVNTNDTISLPALEMAPSSSITITFDSVVMDTVVPGQVLNNETRASYTSLVNGGRDNSSAPGAVDDDNDTSLDNYEESASQSLTVKTQVAIDKQVDKTQATVGDTVVFTVRASFQEGTIPSLTIHDVLPDGLGYVSHAVNVGNTGITFSNPDYNNNVGMGQEVIIELGDVSNPANGSTDDDYVDVVITARVLNLTSMQDGTIVRNGEENTGSNVYLTYGQGGGTTRVDFDTDPNESGNQGIPVEIIEPDLTISKTVSPTSQSLGDLVTFTVTVAHSGSSRSDGRDVVVTDTLPSGLSYVDSSLPAADVTANGQSLEFRLGSISLSQGQKGFTYRARINLDAVVGQALTNSAHLTWKSISGATGDTASGRTGADCAPGLNDYCDDDSATVTPTATAAVDAKKTVQIVDDADRSGSATSGDILEYTVVITNGQTNVTGAIFADTIPENTTYVPGSITVNSVSMTDAQDGDQADFDSHVPNGISVAIGDMSPGQSVTITFRVRINDFTPAGVIISNQGVVDTDQSVPEPTDEDGIDSNGDQPTDIPVGGGTGASLRAEKTVSLTGDTVSPTGTINVGDEVTYTIRITNTGSVPLHNVTYTDNVPAGVTISGVNNGQWTAPSSTVTANFPVINAGGSELITITGTVNETGTLVNQGTADSDETDQVLTDGDTDPENGDQPTSFVAVAQGGTGVPLLGLTKRIEATGDTNNDGLINPGETFRYVMALTNTGSAAASGVTLTDNIPAHVSLVPGSVHTSKGAVVSESPLSINIGDVAIGESISIYFDVKVDSDTPLGTTISNQATVTDGSGNSVVSDDPGTDDGTDCTSSATNCNDGDTGNDDPTDTVVSGAHVFDPPSAFKTGTLGDKSIITWRQVWINNGNAQAINVRIVDPIPEHTTYVQGSLVCAPQGSSTTTRCEYDAAQNRVVWEGSIGADPGASNEDNATNEVIIEFQSLVQGNPQFVQNQTTGYWDRDGDDFIDDDISGGQIAITSNAQVPVAVRVPTLSEWGWILMALSMLLAVIIRRPVIKRG